MELEHHHFTAPLMTHYALMTADLIMRENQALCFPYSLAKEINLSPVWSGASLHLAGSTQDSGTCRATP